MYNFERREKMKKIICIIAMLSTFSAGIAQAETIVVVNDNNVVTQRIITSQPQVVVTQPAYVPQTQVVTQPVIVRETEYVRNYHYDPIATAAAVGITGIAIGGLLFGHHHHHHGGHHVIRGGHRGGHHGGGHHRR